MTRTPRLTRRATLALGAAGTASLLMPQAAFAQIDRLAIHGPPAGPSITLAHAVATGQFAEIASEASFAAWRTPDELRAGLTSGDIRLSVVPVQAAANLYNRGFPIRLANVMTNGLLYIVAEDAGITEIDDLAGRHVAVPYRGDTPEIFFGQLLAHHGVGESDLQITYAASPTEAMQLMLAGRVDAALTTEPSTTAAVLRAKQVGRDIKRVISIQKAWGEMMGAAPVLPQAGLAVTQPFLDANADDLSALLGIVETATAAVLADPETAASNASGALGMPAPLLAASIPSSNLVAHRASEAREDIERMLTGMAGEDFARIGGALPDDAFYL
ncbi:ABC transporter substrate-binding protein [Rhodobacteraceae bacterium F11138]|nr:ABC transporter substrate-binding protein [Rhodobacteraceae bacterium F11138]